MSGPLGTAANPGPTTSPEEQQAEADGQVPAPEEMTLPVTFHLRNPLNPAELIGKARELDRADGYEGVAYTVQQALTMVFHGDPGWLFDRPYDDRILDGWELDTPPDMWASWEPKTGEPRSSTDD